MAAANRLTAIEITNQVQRRIGVNTTSTFTATKQANMLLDFINEIIADLNDYGNWQELYQEVFVTTVSGQAEYAVAASGREIHHIHEIALSGYAGALLHRSINDIRVLQRGTNAVGVPRQWTTAGVNVSANPVIRVHPRPNSTVAGNRFNIAIYQKERLLTTSDTAYVPVWPAPLLVQGVYAKALLEENGGEPSREWEAAYQMYEKLKRETWRRLNADMDDHIQIIPHRYR